jgi:hypothetical protein
MSLGISLHFFVKPNGKLPIETSIAYANAEPEHESAEEGGET